MSPKEFEVGLRDFQNMSPEEQRQHITELKMNDYLSALKQIKELLQEDSFENWEECVHIADEAIRL